MRTRCCGVRIVQVLTFLTAVLLGVTPTFAVHDKAFELDGNIKNDPAGAQTTDWADLFQVSGSNVPTPKASLPAGFGPANFSRDFAPGGSSDATTYATGSKDTLPIVGGWQCTKSNNVNDKTDALNAYIVAYIDAQGHRIVYFGIETASNEGTRDVGIWLLKDQSVGCTATSGKALDFSGTHNDGDILIVAEYTGSNGVSTIKAFRWNGDGITGSLGSNASVVGTDCRQAAAGDFICARTNSSPILHGDGVPWLTQTKSSNPSVPGLTSADLDVAEFFEGGIDLTASNLDGCFTNSLFDTRSSATVGATIFDYTVVGFPLCGISVDKACAPSTPTAPNPVPTGDGEKLHTIFNVPITSKGGTVFNVTLQEGDKDGNLPTGLVSCQLTGVDGPIVPVALGKNPVVVATSLNGTLNATVECDSTTNPFVNTVTVTAKSSSQQATQDLVASHTTTSAQTCSFNGSPLTVEKKCHTPGPAVTLVAGGGFKVCVDIKLTNNSSEDAVGITITDNPALTITSDPIGVSNPGGGSLEHGASATVSGCYTTANADNNETNPCLAKFKDQLTSVTATGKVSGDNIAPTGPLPSAECPLCACPTP